MLVYILMLFISMFFAAYAENVKHEEQLKSTYRYLAVLSCIPFLLVSMFRYWVGTDWVIYDEYFLTISNGGKKFSEPLFNFLNRILYFITEDSWILFAVTAFLILLFTFLTIYEQSTYVPLSILIFFVSGDFFNSQNQIRQMLATAIMLYALNYVYERKFWKFLLFLIIATGIHVSAVVFIVAYFLYGKKVNLKTQIITYIVLLASSPLIGKLVRFVLSKTKFGWYIGSVYDMSNFYLIGFIFTVFFLAIFYYYLHYNLEEDKKFNLYVNMYYIGALTILFSSIIPQADRITKLFTSVTFLAIPRLVIREDDRNRRILLYMLVVAAFVVKLLYDVYINGWYDALPYRTILEVVIGG